MGKSRAEIQKEYRERKKNAQDATEYLRKERERAKLNYGKLKFLTNEEILKRREKCRNRLRKYRKKIKEEKGMSYDQTKREEEPGIIYNCDICDKTFSRETTFIKHKQTVHGPMMNCVDPQCNYSEPESRPGQLQQHMARVHDMYYYKGASITASNSQSGDHISSTTDPGMAEENLDKERICAVLRDSVLNLCKQNYTCAIEVDGLICISVLNSKEQHVVKIHDLLTENGHLFTSINSVSKSNVRQNREWGDNSSESQPHPLLVVQNSSANNQNEKKSQTAANTRRKGPNSSSTSTSKVTSENSSRFPFLVQTLQENRKIPPNRASSASPTIPSGSHIQQNRNSLFGNMTSNTVIDKERPASNLLKILSTHKQQQQQSKENDYTEQSYDNSNELIVSVKREPIDEEMTDQDMRDNSKVQEQENTGIMNVKSEPTWNESEYGVTSNSNQMDQSDGDSNPGTQNESLKETFSNQTDPVCKGNKSILANILNGREESYTKSRKSLVSLAAKASSVSPNRKKGTEKVDEQDNSLLYRLPFVTFQDLFPGSPTGDTQVSQQSDTSYSKASVDVKNNTKAGKSMNLEFLMRKMLEDKTPEKRKMLENKTAEKRKMLENKTGEKRKRPQRRNNKASTTSTETADFISEEYSEEDFDSPASDKEDEVYVPSMVADDDEDQEFTMSLRNKGAKKKLKKSIAVKSSKKSRQQSEKDANDTQEEDPSKYKYACYHCQLSFIDRLERDRHEEENCIKELIICIICKGYFANTSSRNKHLWEVHKVLSDEQKDEIKENRQGVLEELRTMEQPEEDQHYEFETLKDSEDRASLRIESFSSVSQPQFDLEASSSVSEPKCDVEDSSVNHNTTLVTKFIVPFSKENADSFIKCPLCINLFSDLASKDEHLRKKHKVANQIDNGDGTVSLQLLESKPSNVPPIFVKFEKVTN